MPTVLKRADEIQEVLSRACARNEILILVTPYLKFESFFVALEPGEVQVAATMSREDAVYGLRSEELKIRFPSEVGFLEGPARLLGLGLREGRRTLRLALPRQLQENDYRAEYRVERVGRVLATFGTPRGDLLQASLVDLSLRGARLHTPEDPAELRLDVGSRLLVSIPLTPEIRIEAQAEVRHLGPRTIGMLFDPKLPEPVQEPLSRWVFRHREEDQERLAQQLERRFRNPPLPRPQADPGVLLVSGDADLEAALREALEPFRPLTRIAPTAQAIKDALGAPPPLAILHLPGSDLDQRRRIRTLTELVAPRAPVLLLGTQVEGPLLFELAAEWKASSALAWHPGRGAFLLRLAQGIVRRHQGAEGPTVPPAV